MVQKAEMLGISSRRRLFLPCFYDRVESLEWQMICGIESHAIGLNELG